MAVRRPQGGSRVNLTPGVDWASQKLTLTTLDGVKMTGFLRKGMPYQTFSRKGMPYQSFSRKGMPSRAAASDDQVYVGNVALLLFKYDRCSLLGHLRLCRPVSTLGHVIPDIVSMGWSNMSICPDA